MFEKGRIQMKRTMRGLILLAAGLCLGGCGKKEEVVV